MRRLTWCVCVGRSQERERGESERSESVSETESRERYESCFCAQCRLRSILVWWAELSRTCQCVMGTGKRTWLEYSVALR